MPTSLLGLLHYTVETLLIITLPFSLTLPAQSSIPYVICHHFLYRQPFTLTSRPLRQLKTSFCIITLLTLHFLSPDLPPDLSLLCSSITPVKPSFDALLSIIHTFYTEFPLSILLHLHLHRSNTHIFAHSRPIVLFFN